MSKLKIIENPPFLDDEERADLAGFDQVLAAQGSTLSLERKAQLEVSAKATTNPAKKAITTRLSEKDLSKLKVKALEKGIGYQTLLASIVHQYVEGTLVEER